MPAVQVDRLETVLVLAGEGQYVAGLNRANRAVAGFDANAAFLRVGAAAGIGAIGIGRFVQAAGRMEQVEVGFRTMLGSAEAARAKISELQDFATKTPFSFAEVAKGGQRLLGVGADARQLTTIMGALGNAVSATGGSTEEFNRALYAVGQVISNKTLQGDELRQLADAGIPLNDLLNELGTSMGDVGKAGITSERFLAALIKTMNSGRFAGAMEAQSKTLFGALSNLGDAAAQLEVALGSPLIGTITNVTRGITGMVNSLNAAPKPVKDLAAVTGVALVGGLAAAAAGMKYLEMRAKWLEIAHWNGAKAATANAAANQALGSGAAGIGGIGKGGLKLPGGFKMPKISGGTVAGIGGGIIADLLLRQLGDGNNVQGDIKRAGTKALEWGMMGSLLGPVGGLAGGAAGAIAGGIESTQMAMGKKSRDPQVDELIAETKRTNEKLDGLKGNLPVSGQVVTGREQMMATIWADTMRS